MKQYSKKDIKKLIDLGLDVSKKSKVHEDSNVIYVDDIPKYLFVKGKYLPTLKGDIESLPSIYIDRGAIPYVTSGAHLMRPGIGSLDEFNASEIIVIRDGEHKKALAIGISLFSSKEIEKMDSGRVVENYHYVRDKIWDLI